MTPAAVSRRLHPAVPISKIEAPLVFCVDDNEIILELLWDILTEQGFRVICESDPIRAITLLYATNFDAAVLDYDMPGCNGIELASMIQREKPHIPVLMFSGTAVPTTALSSVRLFIAKNQGVQVLIDALRRELAPVQA